jgi:Ran GTPase-activating protein (RanGAP) involved in mRNA processing and transport
MSNTDASLENLAKDLDNFLDDLIGTDPQPNPMPPSPKTIGTETMMKSATVDSVFKGNIKSAPAIKKVKRRSQRVDRGHSTSASSDFSSSVTLASVHGHATVAFTDIMFDPLESPVEERLITTAFGIPIYRPAKPLPEEIISAMKNTQNLLRESSAKESGSIMLYIYVVDETPRSIYVQSDMKARDLLLIIARRFEIESIGYFALSDITASTTHDKWLDLDRGLKEQGIGDRSKLMLKVKFFKLPQYSLDHKANHYYYAQIQKSVISGDYYVPELVAAQLAAYQFQIDFGNYDENKFKNNIVDAESLKNYLPKDYLRSTPHHQWAKRISDLYKQLTGILQEDAKWCYLMITRQLPCFGTTYFEVTQGKASIILGINEFGIFFHEDRNDRTQFEFSFFPELKEWRRLQDGFTIKILKKNQLTSDYFEVRIKYESDDQAANAVIELLDGYSSLTTGTTNPQPDEKRVTYAGLLPWYTYAPYRTAVRARGRILEETPRPGYDASSALAANAATHQLHNTSLLRALTGLKSRDAFGSQLSHFMAQLRNVCVADKSQLPQALFHLVNSSFDSNTPLSNFALPSSWMDENTSMQILKAIELNQSYNRLVANDPEKLNFKMKQINLKQNTISAQFAKVFDYTPDLEYLNLSENFDKDTIAMIPPYLPRLSKLVQFYFTHNNFTDKHMVPFIEALSYLPNLRVLDISYNVIKSTNLEVFLKLFTKVQFFEQFSLASNKITDTGIEQLFNTFKASGCRFNVVDLRSNDFGSRGLTAIADYLKIDNRIRKLMIGQNGLGYKEAGILARGLLTARNLLHLECGNNNFSKKGWKEILDAIGKNGNLLGLEVPDGGLDKSSTALLCNYLTQNANLQELHLSGNSLGHTGSSALFEHLKANTSLRLLDISSTSLGKKEIALLAEALVNNHTLTTLNMTSLSLKEDSITHISIALGKNKGLLSLSLDKNQIGNNSIKEIISALSKNTTLQFLSLQENSLSNNCLDDWIGLLAKNCFIKEVDLRRNDFNITYKLQKRLENLPSLTVLKFSARQ